MSYIIIKITFYSQITFSLFNRPINNANPILMGKLCSLRYISVYVGYDYVLNFISRLIKILSDFVIVTATK